MGRRDKRKQLAARLEALLDELEAALEAFRAELRDAPEADCEMPPEEEETLR